MSEFPPFRSAQTAAAASPGQVGATHSPLEILLIFLRLGCTCFGGPIAHLGYFRTELVERRQWLTERAYVDLVALAQFLPGPASSQTGFGIGLMRGGLLGGLAAWTGFTMPSAILMVLFAYGAGTISDSHSGAGLLHGLKLVAVAIVAQAVMGMARSLCPDRVRTSIATVALIVMLLAPWSVFQIGTIVVGGLAGWILCRGDADTAPDSIAMPVSRKAGIACLAAFFVLLAFAFLPVRAGALALFDAFYRSGAATWCCPYCATRSSCPVGYPTILSSLATAPPKLCRARCSPSPHISGPSPEFRPAVSPARLSPWSRFSFRAFSAFWALFPSGTRCEASPQRKRPCAAPMRLSSACSARRFTIRSGQVRCRGQQISRSPRPALSCLSRGAHRRWWWFCFLRQPVSP
jgi:chromate transport protein ChrA